MKIERSNKIGTRGSALIIVLVFGTLMLLSVGGYLTMVEHQNYISVRSQSWNTSIAVVEAGIEEAMEHLNANTNHLGTDGWGFDGQRYVLDHDMGDGTGFSVTIDMTDPENPEVTSQGFSTLDGGPIQPIFAAVGMDGRPTLTRAVRVRASRGGLFIKGMVARQSVEMNGNNIMTDSYDSGDPNKSTNGRYDPAKAGNKGDVSVNSSIQNAVNVGNANIYGHVATGPRGTVAVGSNGGVGEKSWVAANSGKVQPGWVTDDMNFTFPEPVLPYTTGLQPTPGYVVSSEEIITAIPHTGVPEPGATDVITNINYAYTSTYPGNQPGLTTNLVWQSTTVPPAPGQAIGPIITNSVTMNSDDWPGLAVGPISTNLYWESSTLYPSGQTVVFTNLTSVTETFLPSPLPSGQIKTNTTLGKRQASPPPAGTYVGTPVKIQGWWHYNEITGYTWYLKEYFWLVREYNWQQTYYAYQMQTYGLPSYTYSWTGFTTNYIYSTNFYDHILNSGKYVMTSLSGKTYVSGQAELVVYNNIKMSGNDALTIDRNGSLHVYVDGGSSAISGNGVINKTGVPAKCIIEFTPNVTSVNFSGNGEFVGVLIAPFAAIKMNGGGNAVTDFCGAVIGDTIVMNGHFKFHYDEALGRLPRNGRYLVDSWDEIDPGTAFTVSSL